MIIRIKKKTIRYGINTILILTILGFIFLGVTFDANYVVGATNITNNTVYAKVNVTNTPPNITSIVVDDYGSGPANEIDLTASGVRIVSCNATVFDYNGWGDVNPNKTNATLFISSVGTFGDSDNNYRYVNSSCGSCRQGATSTTAICDCNFAVQYYANASNQWYCNVSVKDFGGTSGGTGGALNLSDNDTSTTAVTITNLLAINTSGLIDYGNLSVTQTSSEMQFNATNVGNLNLNLTLRGYGGTVNDSEEYYGNNYTMVCDFGNISIGNQRYWLGESGAAFDSMRILTNTSAKTNFTLFQRTDDTANGNDKNSTYWRLSVPLGVGGLCNGTIIFGATQS